MVNVKCEMMSLRDVHREGSSLVFSGQLAVEKTCFAKPPCPPKITPSTIASPSSLRSVSIHPGPRTKNLGPRSIPRRSHGLIPNARIHALPIANSQPLIAISKTSLFTKLTVGIPYTFPMQASLFTAPASFPDTPHLLSPGAQCKIGFSRAKRLLNPPRNKKNLLL